MLDHTPCRGKVCDPTWFTVTDDAGVTRWPSVPIEILFNMAVIALFFILRRNDKLPGQHFHLYLVGYGVFRFAHEFEREEPRVFGPITGYQIAALAVRSEEHTSELQSPYVISYA